MNTIIAPITVQLDHDKLISDLTPDQTGELNLYYVAASRCKKRLINANYL